MKRVSILFVVTLMAVIAAPVLEAGAREYRGPERGKMGWGAEAVIQAAFTPQLPFVQALGTHEYSGPERGKMGWGLK